MKRLLPAILLLAVSSYTAPAQNTNSWGVGARICPDGGGLSLKYFPDKNVSLELQVNGSGGMYNTGNDGPSVEAVGLVEYNLIFRDPSWRLFFGPGLHGGSWDRYANSNTFDRNRPAQSIFGIDGIFGVEYILRSIPLGFSADLKPAVNLATDVTFFPNNMLGFSAHYYFNAKMLRSRRPGAPRG